MKLLVFIFIVFITELIKHKYREKSRKKLQENIEHSFIVKVGVNKWGKKSKINDFIEKIRFRFDRFRFSTIYEKLFKFESNKKIYNTIVTRYIPLLFEILLKVFLVASWFYFLIILLYIIFSFVIVYYEEIFLSRYILSAVARRHFKTSDVATKLKLHLDKVNVMLFDLTKKIESNPDRAIRDLWIIRELRIHYISKVLKYLRNMNDKECSKYLEELD